VEPRLLAGRYELQEQLGSSTWRATDTELGRDVLVRIGGAVDAAAALSHPGIVRVFDQGEEAGERFAVLEYVPGGSLAERGGLTAAAAAEVAAALAYAHEQGVVHGALDANAILLDAEGRAKLTGFRGEGDPAADLAALDALRGDTEITVVAAPLPAAAPPPPRRSRRPLALLLVAAALVAAGIGAAFLFASDDSPTDEPTTSVSVSEPTTGTTAETEPLPAPTTEETTTATTATTETQPTTTSDTQPPPTTLPPPTTDGPLPTVPTLPPTLPPEPTEPAPTITEPPPTTTEEPLPPTTTEG
jgi:hypothetical protein